jgi:hypothetical protein
VLINAMTSALEQNGIYVDDLLETVSEQQLLAG